MVFNVVILFVVISYFLGIFVGYCAGKNITVYDYTAKAIKEKEDTRYRLKKEQLERMSIWDIVRYKPNGVYDCVWSGMHTKRDADKICKELNEDYHKNYGKYVVERNGCI